MPTPGASRPPQGVLVLQPDEGRAAHSLRIGGMEVLIKVAGADTNDRLSCFLNIVPPMSGPPLHQHTREDEVFYVLDGEVTFEIDGERLSAGAGTTLLAPRLSIHTFQNVTQTTARLLITVSPGGMDRMFVEAAALAGDNLGAAFGAISAKYGLKVIGPPLRP